MEPGKLSETILVVDNCNVRISYKDCWKLKGYTVLMATDAGTVMKVQKSTRSRLRLPELRVVFVPVARTLVAVLGA